MGPRYKYIDVSVISDEKVLVDIFIISILNQDTIKEDQYICVKTS